MGIFVSVYKDDQIDCTNAGVSSKHGQLLLVNAEGPFGSPEAQNAVKMESHVGGCLRLVPVEWNGNTWVVKKGWFMMGGNYGATTDSRFSKLAEKLLGYSFYGAVAIHDRLE